MDSANAASAASRNKGSSLGQRLLSAVVLMPVVLALIWWSYWVVVVVVAIVTVISLLELYGAFQRGGYQPRVWLGLGIALALCLSVAAHRQFALPFDPLAPLLTLAVIASMVAELPRRTEKNTLTSWALTLAGALYVGWLFSHFIALRGLETPLLPNPLAFLHIHPGAAWLYFVLAVTWAQDTAAYFAGRAFGRHKMAPTLSPKKTWEGAVGGFASSILIGAACVPLFGLPISLAVGALLGLVAGIIGPLGDLAESLIKRHVGVKDAGDLIPGHGGLLDRVDSALFTAPVLFYLIVLLVQ